jgi:hypothetical protein
MLVRQQGTCPARAQGRAHGLGGLFQDAELAVSSRSISRLSAATPRSLDRPQPHAPLLFLLASKNSPHCFHLACTLPLTWFVFGLTIPLRFLFSSILLPPGCYVNPSRSIITINSRLTIRNISLISALFPDAGHLIPCLDIDQ